MQVDRFGEAEEVLRRERRRERLAVVIEVVLDREPEAAVAADGGAVEPVRELRRRALGRQRERAGERERIGTRSRAQAERDDAALHGPERGGEGM